MEKTYTISVYMDDGRVFEYDVDSEEKVREHSDAIVKNGYRHCSNAEDGVFEQYGAHRILKVKSYGIKTMYQDRVRGT